MTPWEPDNIDCRIPVRGWLRAGFLMAALWALYCLADCVWPGVGR